MAKNCPRCNSLDVRPSKTFSGFNRIRVITVMRCRWCRKTFLSFGFRIGEASR